MEFHKAGLYMLRQAKTLMVMIMVILCVYIYIYITHHAGACRCSCMHQRVQGKWNSVNYWLYQKPWENYMVEHILKFKKSF